MDARRNAAGGHHAPVRAGVGLLDVGSSVGRNSKPAATELVLLPAEVVPDSAVPDPDGHWLALITRAAVAPGSNNLLSLWPSERIRREAVLTDARPQLTETAADRAWQRGRRTPVDQMVALALDLLHSPDMSRK